MASHLKTHSTSRVTSLLLLGLMTSSVVCKPTFRFDKSNEDPLLAMPTSGVYLSSGNYEQTTPQAIHSPQVQYVQSPGYTYNIEHQQLVSPYQASAQYLMPEAQHTLPVAQPELRTHVRYVSEPETVQRQQRDCDNKGNQQVEYVAVSSNEEQETREPNRDYPGEIVYIGSNKESQSEQIVPKHESASQDSPFFNLNKPVIDGTGLPATILTEVPEKDLPFDVLEKLKRDYGVRVVATRNRPGATLVLNCEDESGAGNVICSRQGLPEMSGLPYSDNRSYNYNSNHQTMPNGPETEVVNHHQVSYAEGYHVPAENHELNRANGEAQAQGDQHEPANNHEAHGDEGYTSSTRPDTPPTDNESGFESQLATEQPTLAGFTRQS